MTTVSQSGQALTGQKIYLSRVTADLEISDATGHLDSPDALVDRADISPGFLVTSPSSYTAGVPLAVAARRGHETHDRLPLRAAVLAAAVQPAGFRETNCNRHSCHLEAVAPNCFDLDTSSGSFSSASLFRALLMSCARCGVLRGEGSFWG